MNFTPPPKKKQNLVKVISVCILNILIRPTENYRLFAHHVQRQIYKTHKTRLNMI